MYFLAIYVWHCATVAARNYKVHTGYGRIALQSYMNGFDDVCRKHKQFYCLFGKPSTAREFPPMCPECCHRYPVQTFKNKNIRYLHFCDFYLLLLNDLELFELGPGGGGGERTESPSQKIIEVSVPARASSAIH